jgi:CRP-like cAMP-binding protein
VLLRGEQIAHVADLFGQKFPSLSPGSTMSISFFRITPTEIQFIDNTSAGQSEAGTFGAEFHRERSYSVITDLPRQVADTFVASLQPVEVPAGETIVRGGGPADRFFILVEGEAVITTEQGGEERPLRPNQLFGEVTIMRDQPRVATVRAQTDTKLLALERDTFRDLIAQAMEITPDFDQVIRSRLDAQGAG